MFPLVIMLMPDGDDKTFMENLYHKYYRLMFSTAWAYVDDKLSAEEIISDACLALIRNLQTLRTLECNKLTGYIVSTVRNKAFDHLAQRKIRNQRLAPLDEVVFSKPDASIDIENHIVLQEEVELVLKAIDSLPSKERMVILLKYTYGLDYKTIAKVVEISEESVHKYLSRARNKIKTYVYGRR